MLRTLPAFVLAASLLAPSFAEVEHASFDGGGAQLHYTRTGTGTPVVLLSGGPGLDVGYLLPAAEFLPPGYAAIAYEQRGTGRSRPPDFDAKSLTLRGAVEDLELLRVHLRQERLVLLGHSWGGMLSMAYAAAHPERVERLILVGSGGPTMEFLEWFGDNIEARLLPEDIAARDSWIAASKDGVDAGKVALETMRAIVPAYFFDREVGLTFARSMAEGTYHRDVNQQLFAELGAGYDVRAGLKKLKRPALIVHGHQDPIGQRTAEELRALLAESKPAYIRRCGHFPWLEQPAAFRAALAEFLPAAVR
jgi:proline iminopeptidase